MIIKPCPFCGGHAYLEEAFDKAGPLRSWAIPFTRVCCETCGASTRKFYRHGTTPEELLEDDPHEIFVVTQWNTRREE